MGKRIVTALRRRGASVVQYGFLLGLIGVVVLLAIQETGTRVAELFRGLADSIDGSANADATDDILARIASLESNLTTLIQQRSTTSEVQTLESTLSGLVADLPTNGDMATFLGQPSDLFGALQSEVSGIQIADSGLSFFEVCDASAQSQTSSALSTHASTVSSATASGAPSCPSIAGFDVQSVGTSVTVDAVSNFGGGNTTGVYVINSCRVCMTTPSASN